MRPPLSIALAAILAAATSVPMALAQDTPDAAVEGTLAFDMRVVTTGLEGPWEVTMGPDGWLWVTERTAGRITRINPADGTKQPALTIDEVQAPGGQDGLLGMALHPNLLKGTGEDYVFAAYTYDDPSRGGDPQVTDTNSPYHDLYTKIVRLTYDEATGTLSEPTEIIAGLPAHNDHNSGRMKIGPDGKIYYTIGDGGKNQLGNWCLPIEAQRIPTAEEVTNKDWIAYQGKSLRLELDGTIPSDNPTINGVQSHVFTYGHRNMQGIAFDADGTLYASEQGPKTDDEVNILKPGANYGWPHVAGYRDDKAYQYARWADATTPCADLEFSDLAIDPSVPVENETAWTEPFEEPLATLFTVPNDWNFADPKCKGIDFICWPTVAASSIEVYPETDAIPGWGHSLLVTTLKRGSIYRIPLDASGTARSGPIERYFWTENRFRDVALSPDDKTIYVATDNGGLAGTRDGGTTTTMENPGSILAYTYTGEASTAAAGAADDSKAAADVAMLGADAPVVGFTAAQAERGKAAYDANCVSCHGPDLKSANYGPPLAGPYFEDKWMGQPASALLAKVHTMPPSRPNSLGDDTYAALAAYILSVNGLAGGDTELSAETASNQGMAIRK